VLFSHPDVVRLLNERFECAWETVRPVPKVTIDFGDGRVLERTLMGNVATYVTRADGGVLDVVAGIVAPEEYERRLARAERLHAVARARPDEAAEVVATWHGADELWSGAVPLAVLEAEQMRADLSKFRVEQGVKELLRPLHVERMRAEALRESPAVLAEDTAYNVRVRDPKVRAILAERPLATPAELTARIYREVLDVDLGDPYLGLAPYVLGGEEGRH
jgi:hypothetical protein